MEGLRVGGLAGGLQQADLLHDTRFAGVPVAEGGAVEADAAFLGCVAARDGTVEDERDARAVAGRAEGGAHAAGAVAAGSVAAMTTMAVSRNEIRFGRRCIGSPFLD